MYKVEAPKVLSPARGGLLPLANVITQDAAIAAYHGVTYEAPAAGRSRTVPAAGASKVFDKSEIVEGVEFGIYRGLDSALLMGTSTDQIARDLFEGGETFAVEEAVQRLLLNPNAVDLTPTPGTPVTNVKAAVGLLSQYAAEQYTGLPLLHANRYITELLDLEVDESNWTLHSQQGTPVANGGGYGAEGPDELEAGAGQGWLYISGQVNLWRGATDIVPASDLKDNRHLVLAEAAYAAAVDTFVAAILVGV